MQSEEIHLPLQYEDIDLPRYKCHKEVKAFKIAEVDYRLEEATLIPESRELLPALVTMEWVSKHGPILPGGYFVCYKDGYESYSPAAPFEEGYSLVEEPQ